MNVERNDECTADPGVMGHRGCTTPGCSCRAYAEQAPSYGGFGDSRATTVRSYSTDRATTVQTYSTYQEPPLVLTYMFIKHQTEKAILFAMQDNNGIYQQWIPRSVILGMTSTQVTIQGWFKSRLL